MKQTKRNQQVEKKRKRPSSVAKDLRTPKYRMRVEVDKKVYNRKKKESDYDLY